MEMICQAACRHPTLRGVYYYCALPYGHRTQWHLCDNYIWNDEQVAGTITKTGRRAK